MKRPNEKDYVIIEGEETDDLPVGAFLPNAYKEAQNKYIDHIEIKYNGLLTALAAIVFHTPDRSTEYTAQQAIKNYRL